MTNYLELLYLISFIGILAVAYSYLLSGQILSASAGNARMQEIADHAGVNKGLLHYYFKNKENIFNEVFVDEFNKIYAELNAILQSKDTMDGKLSRMIEQYFDLLHKNPKLSSFVMFEIFPVFIANSLNSICPGSSEISSSSLYFSNEGNTNKESKTKDCSISLSKS